MLANLDNFQAMIIHRTFGNPTESNEFHIRDTDITLQPGVKLLCVLQALISIGKSPLKVE